MPDSYVIAIVEDDDAVRQSTDAFLRGAGHRVVSYASGVDFLASNPGNDLSCVLLDMRMAGIDGFEVMRVLKQREIAVPVVILTGHGDVPLAVEAMKLGAIDFLEKPYKSADLLEAIRLARTTRVAARRARPVDKDAKARIAALSERQRAVLSGILKGQPNKIIAWELGLSIRTVESYRSEMFSRLGVRGAAGAIRLAIAAGMADA
ncbi:MAG TPA: response regulator [Allosphingosinicella sp.]|nr:response regulator [Allosphingosinicella sp.]